MTAAFWRFLKTAARLGPSDCRRSVGGRIHRHDLPQPVQPAARVAGLVRNSAAYLQTIADVSAFAGQTVQFRLRLGTDQTTPRPGWDVDDVLVQSCQTDCLWDVNQSDFIDIVDVQLVASAWGEAGSPYDLDGSGIVDIGDVTAVADRWNSVCGDQ